MRRLLILALLLTGCTATPTPAPASTPTPNALGTAIVQIANRITVLEILYPELATAAAGCLTPLPTETGTPVAQTATPGPTATATPSSACQVCTTASECLSGMTCANCRGIMQFCVPLTGINGGCADCLAQMFATILQDHEGPPDELIDLDVLVQDSIDRRFAPEKATVTP